MHAKLSTYSEPLLITCVVRARAFPSTVVDPKKQFDASANNTRLNTVVFLRIFVLLTNISEQVSDQCSVLM
jgi:hypothetical protein